MNETDEMLAEYLRLAGKWLIDNAKDVVGSTGKLHTTKEGASFLIHLEPDAMPTITFTRELMMDSVHSDFCELRSKMRKH